MGKIYTLDANLLNNVNEIRIGDKLLAVDDRLETVEKIMALQEDGASEIAMVKQAVKLALGEKAYEELSMEKMPFAACQQLLELVLAAVTGQEIEQVQARFQG